MKRMRFAIFLLVLHTTVFAQQRPVPSARPKSPARTMQVEVFHLGENGEKIAEAGLIVTLKQNGASKETNDLGQCWLPLPEGYAAGEIIVLVIDKTNWRIRYPLDGEARIPLDLKKETVSVELLPVGSKLFWTNDRIEKFVRDLAEKSTQQAPAPGAAEKPDLGRFIKDWAVQYGFSAEQAKEEMDKWIAEIEAKSNDLNRLGLAAFAKKNFAEAANHLEAAFAQDSTQLAAAKKQRLALEEKEKQLTTQAIENARLAGDSHYNDNQFEKALAKYQSAQQLVDKTKAPQQWANLALVIGNANWALGIRTAGEKIQAYLSAAQLAYQQAGEVWPRDREPEDWAMTQNNLGIVYRELGTRTGGEEGAKWLKASVTAYENALVVRTREQLPQQWATT
jgi:tetratricopeptide (TPR) repeat protein